MLDKLIPLKEFVARYPKKLGTESTLRRWIREDYTGFSMCAVKKGRQGYLIDLDAVEEWLKAQRVKQSEKEE